MKKSLRFFALLWASFLTLCHGQAQNTDTLFYAAYNGKTESIKDLVASGADVNLKNSDGTTALMYAANRGHAEIFKILVVAGADTTVKDSRGMDLFFLAAAGGSFDIFKALLDMGADMNEKDAFGGTLLMHAASGGNPEMVKTILTMQTDEAKTTKQLNRALMAAVHGERYGCSLGENANHRKTAAKEYAQIIKLLRDAGADIGVTAATVKMNPEEAAMNAALAPAAHISFNISVAKLFTSEFGKHILVFGEKIKELVAEDDNEMLKSVDEFISVCKTENISFADVKTVFASVNPSESYANPSTPVFAFHFENPLTEKTLQKIAAAVIAWVEHGNRQITIEPVDKGLRYFYRKDDATLFTLLGGNHVVFTGKEPEVKAALERVEPDPSLEYLPQIKFVMDETFTRCDAYFVMTGPDSLEFLDDYFHMDLERKTANNRIQAPKGFALGLDCTDKLTATLTILCDDFDYSQFVGDYVSAVSIGFIKQQLFSLTRVNMPFMESLKVSTKEKTVVVTCEITVKDLELILPVIKKLKQGY